MGYTIYLRTNLVTGKQYVGQTNNFKRREGDWKCFKKIYANGYIDGDREKYGLSNFTVEIIDHCETEEEAYQLEEYYIKEYSTKYPDGYNLTDGGKGMKGFKVSEEHKKKISEALKGEKSPWYGKKHSEETKRKMIENSHKTAVIQYTLDGQFVAEYVSIKDAVKTTGFNQGHICECCNGKRISTSGYVWRYKNECFDKHSITSKLLKPVIQYTLDGQFVAEYQSASDAERKTNIKCTHIIRCCKGKQKTSGGYIWKYAEE